MKIITTIKTEKKLNLKISSKINLQYYFKKHLIFYKNNFYKIEKDLNLFEF